MANVNKNAEQLMSAIQRATRPVLGSPTRIKVGKKNLVIKNESTLFNVSLDGYQVEALRGRLFTFGKGNSVYGTEGKAWDALKTAIQRNANAIANQAAEQ